MKTEYRNYTDEELATRDRIRTSIVRYINSDSKKKRMRTIDRASKLTLTKTLWRIETDWDTMQATHLFLYPPKVVKYTAVDITVTPKGDAE